MYVNTFTLTVGMACILALMPDIVIMAMIIMMVLMRTLTTTMMLKQIYKNPEKRR